MTRCYLGLYRYCKRYEEILKTIDEMVPNKDRREEMKKELLGKYLDYENWIKLYCSFCIKVHAEKRRARLSGRVGVGVTI